MRKGILCCAAFVLIGCTSSPSTSSISPSSSASKESSSQTEESSSKTQETSSAAQESSIEELSSDEEEHSESQEVTSSIPEIVDKISLFNASSHLYCVSDSPEENPFLKTYRHKDYQDVPFVDLDEFQASRRSIIAGLKYHNLVKLQDGRYDLESSFGGHATFDLEKQTVTLTDVEPFYGEFGRPNNDIYYEPSMDCVSLAGSPKTKYLQKNQTSVYDLKKYHMEMVEQNGHLYVPFSFANHLLVTPMLNSIVYNGADFYNVKLISPESNRIRPYSNKNGFLWAYANDYKTRIHFARKDPKTGESYRFEGTLVDMKGAQQPVEAVFKQDGTLVFHSEDIMETVDFRGTWSEKDNVITANLVPGEMSMGSAQVQRIDLREGNYYRVTTRTQKMAEAHYYQLCMDFDYQYGLKNFLGIASFDDELTSLNYKQNLLSQDTAVYYDTLSKWLIGGKMGDQHCTLNHEGFASLRPSISLGATYASYAGPRIDNFSTGYARTGQAKAKLTNQVLNIHNQTAVISISDFITNLNDPFKGIDAYKVPEGTSDVSAYLTTQMNKDSFKGVCYALNEVKKNASIKNVCFDVALNRGGYVMLVPFLSAVMTDDPVLYYEDSISNNRIESHYKADLNGDGVFGGEGDTWKGKYNYYVLQGGGSFSAGNIFPTTAKNGGYAITIGEKTAGGGCGVGRRSDITGYSFLYSANFGFVEKKDDGTFVNSEGGVDPMVAMDIFDVYDLEKLDAKLQTLQQN